MAGNISTGMRARLVTPTTEMIRQITTMKYGLRMAKRDIAYCAVLMAVTFGCTCLSRLQAGAVADHDHFSGLRPTGSRLRWRSEDRASPCESRLDFRELPRIPAPTIRRCQRRWRESGTATTCARLSSVRFTSAYIPGIRIRLGFGTSTSVSMVRVASDTFSSEPRHAPGETAVQRLHANFHLLADVDGGHRGFGNRKN